VLRGLQQTSTAAAPGLALELWPTPHLRLPLGDRSAHGR